MNALFLLTLRQILKRRKIFYNFLKGSFYLYLRVAVITIRAAWPWSFKKKGESHLTIKYFISMNILFPGKFLLIVFSFMLMLSSCSEGDKLDIERSAAAFDIKQGEASIKQSNQLFMKSFEAGDSVAVSNCYTTDAKAMVANMPALEGRDNIKHFISMAMNKGVKNFELETTQIWGDSSILAEEGTYKMSGKNDKQHDKGKYIVLWKQEAGNWKMFRDIWTSDLPPAALKPEEAPVTVK